jgi:hypothetical protein
VIGATVAALDAQRQPAGPESSPRHNEHALMAINASDAGARRLGQPGEPPGSWGSRLPGTCGEARPGSRPTRDQCWR